jgi:hypothetical protein
VTGDGGGIILNRAQEMLKEGFPDFAWKIAPGGNQPA